MMHFSSWSDQMIADAVRCHVNTVRNYRRSLQGSYDVTPQSRIVTGKDGKTYTLPPVPARPPKGSHGVTPAGSFIPGLPANFTPGPGQSIALIHDEADIIFDLVRHKDGGTLVGLMAGKNIIVNPIPFASILISSVAAQMIAGTHPKLVTIGQIVTKHGPHKLPTIGGAGWQHVITPNQEYAIHPLACEDMIQDWMERCLELEVPRAYLEAARAEGVATA